MPPIHTSEKERKNDAFKPEVPLTRNHSSAMRRRLAGMSFEEGQSELSARMPEILGSMEAVHEQGMLKDVWARFNPEELETARIDFGSSWMSSGLDFFRENSESTVNEESYSWRTGMLADNLVEKRRPTEDEGSGKHSVNARNVDREMPEGTQRIEAEQYGEIVDGVLTIDETIPEAFYKGTPDIDDVIQGNLGDCYLLATLVGMANTAGGRARLVEIVNKNGASHTVDFVGLKQGEDQSLSVDDSSRVRVLVSPQRDDGVELREREAQCFELDHKQGRAMIKHHGGRPVRKGGNLWAQASRTLSGMQNERAPVHTVRVNRNIAILWPWLIEKAYAAIGGGYERIGSGGYTNVAMLALMGTDSTCVDSQTWKHEEGEWKTELLPPEQISMIFKSANARIRQGGVVTISTRSVEGMHERGVMDDLWKVRSADEQGIVVKMEKDQFYSWDNLGDYLNPFIQVEKADGSLRAVDPKKVSEEDKEALIAAVNAGRIVEVSSKTYLHEQGLKLVPGHAYTVLSVSSRGLEVHNPWGSYQPGREVRIEEYANYFDYMQISDVPETAAKSRES